jgi:hypothetical protein
MRNHRLGISNWKSSELPGWLTRDVYVNQIQPALAEVSKSSIREASGVSEPYSSDIRAGKCIPHQRHWQALAQLVGGVHGELYAVLSKNENPELMKTETLRR